MPRLYNIDVHPVAPDGANSRAVFPGEGRDFSVERAAELLRMGRWSEKNPRAGLEAELAFKAARKQDPAPPDEQE